MIKPPALPEVMTFIRAEGGTVMQKDRFIRKAIIRTLVLSLFPMIFGIFGCGGGGESGGSTPSSITYTGSTTEAAITSTNAGTLAEDAYSGGSMGTLFSTGAVTAGESPRPRTLQLTKALKNAVDGVDLSAARYEMIAGASITRSGSTAGDCGGSAAYTITYDDVSGNFSGTMSFNSYCSENTVLSGSAVFSGTINTVTEEFLAFIFTFTELTGTSGVDSFSLKGNISFTRQPSSFNVTLDWLIRNNNTRMVYWMHNCSMTLTEGSGYVDFQISGFYYDPDHGYVSISTTNPFRIYSGDQHPSEGVLVITGRTGSASGSTAARLTALSPTTYRVDADTDGDGAYDDWSSGILNWNFMNARVTYEKGCQA
jgi:hypothetical protein